MRITTDFRPVSASLSHIRITWGRPTHASGDEVALVAARGSRRIARGQYWMVVLSISTRLSA